MSELVLVLVLSNFRWYWILLKPVVHNRSSCFMFKTAFILNFIQCKCAVLNIKCFSSIYSSPHVVCETLVTNPVVFYFCGMLLVLWPVEITCSLTWKQQLNHFFLNTWGIFILFSILGRSYKTFIKNKVLKQ